MNTHLFMLSGFTRSCRCGKAPAPKGAFGSEASRGESSYVRCARCPPAWDASERLMCGIVGVLNLEPGNLPVERETLGGMLEAIRHRGPDGFGIYRDARIGLGSARLSIIDLSGGDQPIGNEDGSLWIVYNGEIFNYVELRPELEARGHSFTTQSDTEVIVHLYEEYGPDCLRI